MVVSANDVKKRGVGIFEELLQTWDEVVVAVRGKNKYIVMDVERYNKIRTQELDMAYKEVMEDYKNGEYKAVSAKEHIDALKRELNV